MKPYKNKDWLIEQYLHKQLSVRQIGKLVGVSGFTIHHWLKKHNIKRRSNSESQLKEKGGDGNRNIKG